MLGQISPIQIETAGLHVVCRVASKGPRDEVAEQRTTAAQFVSTSLPFFSDSRISVAATFLRVRDDIVIAANPTSHRDKDVLEELWVRFQNARDEIIELIEGSNLTCAVMIASAGKIIIARDKLGTDPTYYRESSGDLLCSTDLNLFYHLPHVNQEIDRESAISYLLYGRPRMHCTNSGGVSSLPAGRLIDATAEQGIVIKLYWTPLAKPLPLIAAGERLELLSERMEKAVRNVYSPDNNAIFLSGGLDSSYICYVGSKIKSSNVCCYTISYADSRYEDEYIYAKEVSDSFGFRLKRLHLTSDEIIRYLKDIIKYPFPVSAWSTILNNALLDAASEDGYTNVISGFGSDEVFASCTKMFDYYFSARDFMIKGDIDDNDVLDTGVELHEVLFPGVADFFLRSDLADHLDPTIPLSFIESDLRDFYRVCGPVNRKSNLLSYFVNHECSLRIPDLILKDYRVHADNKGMHIHYPFLESEFVEYACSLYPRERIEFSDNRWKFKIAMRRMVFDKLPPSVLKRPRGLFDLPFERLLREEHFCEEVRSIIRTSNLWSCGLLKQSARDHFLAQLEWNLEGRRQKDRFWANKLWAILTLAAWYDHKIIGKIA